MSHYAQMEIERGAYISRTADRGVGEIEIESLDPVSAMYAAIGLAFLFAAGQAMIYGTRPPSQALVEKAYRCAEGSYVIWDAIQSAEAKIKATKDGDGLLSLIQSYSGERG